MHLLIDAQTRERSTVLPGQRLRTRLTAGVMLGLSLMLIAGCKPQLAAAPSLRFNVALDPVPPKVGPVTVRVVVADAEGKPVEGATVRVEGNMNHAGMKPSFAELTEEQPGKYLGTLDFTMGGDWFLLITTTTRDGTKTEHQFDVPGVQAK